MTTYIILKKLDEPLVFEENEGGPAAAAIFGDRQFFEPIGEAEAKTDKQAIREFAGRESIEAGEFVAVPKRNWHPRTLTPQRKAIVL